MPTIAGRSPCGRGSHARSPTTTNLRAVVGEHVRPHQVAPNALAAGATFFAFVGVDPRPPTRLTSPPLGQARAAGLVYLLLIVVPRPLVGHAAARICSAAAALLGSAGAGGGAHARRQPPGAPSSGSASRRQHALDGDDVPASDPAAVFYHRGTATSLHQTVNHGPGGAGAIPGLWLDDGWHAVVAALAVLPWRSVLAASGPRDPAIRCSPAMFADAGISAVLPGEALDAVHEHAMTTPPASAPTCATRACCAPARSLGEDVHAGACAGIASS